MVRFHLPPWIGRVAVALLVAAAIAFAVTVWLHANWVRSEFLVPQAHVPGESVQIVGIGGGRIVLPRTEGTARDGVWGLSSETAYGQVGEVIRITETEVERTLRTFSGSFDEGQAAQLDVDAFPEDPETAHGLGFENPGAPGPLGPQPTWIIEGRRDTWVVFIHGDGIDRRTQALRMIPGLVEQGFSVAVATYRNDRGAPRSPDGLRRWGLDEWQDLDAAMVTVQRQGAANVVLYAFDLGAQVAAMFLHESKHAGMVSAVVLDSPVLDMERFVDDRTMLPGPIAEVGRQLAAIRFGMEWPYLDQVERSAAFDVPILVLHGADDQVAPFSASRLLADRRPDIVELARFEQGGHGDLWNTDPLRYEDTVADFLFRVIGPE